MCERDGENNKKVKSFCLESYSSLFRLDAEPAEDGRKEIHISMLFFESSQVDWFTVDVIIQLLSDCRQKKGLEE